jgi:hypothetical protein
MCLPGRMKFFFFAVLTTVGTMNQEHGKVCLVMLQIIERVISVGN